MINDKKDDVEDEESDEEYENAVVMEEIGDDSDQEEAADTGKKVKQMKIYITRVTMKATMTIIMRTTKTMITTTMMSATKIMMTK